MPGMPTKRGPRPMLLVALVVAAALVSCARPAALNPQGPGAARITDLWWAMFWLATVIYIGVMGFIAVALFRRRGANPGPVAGRRFIVAGGIILPSVVLLLLFVLTLRALDASATRETAFTVQVTGRQFWWEVKYPTSGFVTANEIHIPVGQPVRLELASEDVVHNLWVPELLGKFDLIPGKTNVTWIQADQPGEYMGLCAEYCGIQHAKMRFVVIAVPPEQFAAWQEGQRQPAAAPTDPLLLRGQQVFLAADCGTCHTIAGTNIAERAGPDLTHLASRRTLGAGSLPNNRGNLAGWLLNPQSIKPGNKMPPTALSGEDLQALLAYLERLE